MTHIYTIEELINANLPELRRIAKKINLPNLNRFKKSTLKTREKIKYKLRLAIYTFQHPEEHGKREAIIKFKKSKKRPYYPFFKKSKSIIRQQPKRSAQQIQEQIQQIINQYQSPSVQIRPLNSTSQSVQIRPLNSSSQSVQIRPLNSSSQSVQIRPLNSSSQSVQIRPLNSTSQSVQIRPLNSSSQSVQIRPLNSSLQSANSKYSNISLNAENIKDCKKLLRLLFKMQKINDILKLLDKKYIKNEITRDKFLKESAFYIDRFNQLIEDSEFDFLEELFDKKILLKLTDEDVLNELIEHVQYFNL
jgi:hypothetical protein